MRLFIYSLLPLTLLLFSSVMRYILLLLTVVVITLRFAATFRIVRRLLLLVIITVYIGAIITLFVYVSAVAPNDYISKDPYTHLLVLLSTLVALIAFLAPSSNTNSREIPLLVSVSEEMFSGFGLLITGRLTLVLLLILLVSTYSSPSLSVFRSIA